MGRVGPTHWEAPLPGCRWFRKDLLTRSGLLGFESHTDQTGGGKIILFLNPESGFYSIVCNPNEIRVFETYVSIYLTDGNGVVPENRIGKENGEIGDIL